MPFILALLTMTALSFLGFWKENGVLFMIVAGLAMMMGLNAPDIMTGSSSTTGTDIAVSLSLVAYSILSVGWALKLLLRKEE